MKPFDKFTLGSLFILVFAVGAFATVQAWRRPASSTDGKRITFAVPTPAPVEIFWIDTAGNLGLRGVSAIVPGRPVPLADPKGQPLPPACRASAEANGDGTITICMTSPVGLTLAQQLGLTPRKRSP